MFRIAVCDDDEQMVQTNISVAQACLRELGVGGEIVDYTRSDNLLYDITEDRFFFDLILLDIEMPGDDGMRLAEKIKPFLPGVKIIFITSHREYAIDAFELAVFRYVPKDEMDKRLHVAITDAIKLLMLESGQVYTIKTNNRLERIPYKDILYIERDGKNGAITTVNGRTKVRKSLQQIFDELAAEEFIFIDRGCIVNMIHIMQIKDGQVLLQNKTALAISRSHLQTVKEQLNRYWGAHI